MEVVNQLPLRIDNQINWAGNYRGRVYGAASGGADIEVINVTREITITLYQPGLYRGVSDGEPFIFLAAVNVECQRMLTGANTQPDLFDNLQIIATVIDCAGNVIEFDSLQIDPGSVPGSGHKTEITLGKYRRY